MTLSHSYLWSDLDIFSEILSKNLTEDSRVVVEVATGPNIVLPHLLEKLNRQFLYISIDTEGKHLQLQKQGAPNFPIHSLVGDASALPLKDSRADLFVFHHAIDDILETVGFDGLRKSVREALRVLKREGTVIFSHCVFASDPYTEQVTLGDIEEMLKEFSLCQWERYTGRNQDWLIAKKIQA